MKKTAKYISVTYGAHSFSGLDGVDLAEVEARYNAALASRSTQQQPFTGRAMSAFEVAQMQEDMTHLRVLWRAFRSDCSTAQYMEYKDAITEILER